MIRIEYLKLSNHPQLGSIELSLSDIKEINNLFKPYSSVIIGPNGTGKSFILREIAEIFRLFVELKNEERKTVSFSYDIHLRYKFHHNTYEIISREGFISAIKKEQRKEYVFYKNRPLNVEFFDSKSLSFIITNYEVLFRELEFPNRLIVNSILQTDRFVFKNNKPDNFYQYLGARSTNSTSSTKSASRKTIKYLFNSSTSDNDFLKNLRDLLSFLDFEKKLQINYTTKINKLFFSGNLSERNFRRYYEEWWHDDFEFSNRKKENPLWSVPYYQNNFQLNPNLIASIVEFLNRISKDKLIHKPRSSAKIISVDLFDNDMSNKDMEMLRHLEALDIINLDGIKINKNNSTMSLNDVSSGEFHLIISMIGIFSQIKNDSIVLIDEPEVSLHPNWQMQYITFLKKVFSKYPSCHFILTSHSHFIVSDLEGESSSVTSINRDEEGKLKTKLIEADTYGWSAEEVLYSVFNVRTTRNLYIEKDIRELLHLISVKSNKVKYIKEILKKIEPLVLNEIDPLNLVINKAREYVNL
ncbi:AAA family ATPase [Chryseobacterium sp. VD8]|uniref:AAA family ATPase n=1 Tax=Chryseobacterium sp. VD8 TaxID=3081254 RepID=UPI0030176437